jgi:hypothetical protein
MKKNQSELWKRYVNNGNIICLVVGRVKSLHFYIGNDLAREGGNRKTVKIGS